MTALPPQASGPPPVSSGTPSLDDPRTVVEALFAQLNDIEAASGALFDRCEQGVEKPFKGSDAKDAIASLEAMLDDFTGKMNRSGLLYASPLHGDGETPKPLHDIYTESDRKVQGAHRDLSVLRQSCAVSGNVASTSPAGKQ